MAPVWPASGRGHSEGAQRAGDFRPRGAAARRGRQGHLRSPTAKARAPGPRPAASARSPASTPTATMPTATCIPQIYHGRTRRERHEELIALRHRRRHRSRRASPMRSLERPGPHPHERAVGDGGRRAHPARRARRRARPHPRRHLRRRHALPHRRDLRAATASIIIRSCPRRAPSAPCGSAPITSSATGWAAWSTRIRGSPAAITASPTAKTREQPEAPVPARRRAARDDARIRPRRRRRSSWPAACGACANGRTGSTIPSSGRSPSSSARGRS